MDGDCPDRGRPDQGHGGRSIRAGTVHAAGARHLAAEQLASAEHWLSLKKVTAARREWNPANYSGPRLRIAYLSADYHRHATAHLIAELLELHDRSRFEIIGISFGPDDRSELRARLVKSFDRSSTSPPARMKKPLPSCVISTPTSRSTSRATPPTAGPEFWRSAPRPSRSAISAIRARWGRTSSTTSSPTAIVLPFDQQRYYSERIVQLPDCYQVNDRKRAIAQRPRAACRASRRCLRLLLLQQQLEAQPADIRDLDAASRDDRAKRAVAVQAAPRCGRKSARAGRGLRGRSGPADIRPSARSARPSRAGAACRPVSRHAALQRPYHGERRIVDGRSRGDLRGRDLSGTGGLEPAAAVGLPELVTTNLNEYEALARALAADPTRLCAFRELLQERRATWPCSTPTVSADILKPPM